MPDLARCTMFFTQQNTGWTETHFRVGNTSTLPSMVNVAIGLMRLRSLLLGTGVVLRQARLSFDGIFRDAVIVPGPTPITMNGSRPHLPYYNDNWPEANADFAYSVAKVRGEAGTLYRKTIYLSGAPDFMQNVPGPPFEPIWLTFLKQYRDSLVNDGWGFPVLLRETDGPAATAISGVDFTVFPIVITSVGHGLQTGDRVRIRQVHTNTTTLNMPNVGVTRLTADTFSVNGSAASPGRIWTFGGFVQKLVRAVVPYTDVKLIGFTHRNRGRPFDTPVGRHRRPRQLGA